MRVIRKQRAPQGIYAWTPEQLRALDEMLGRNLTYKEIAATLAAVGLRTSAGALSEYYGRGLKSQRADVAFANGTRTITSNRSMAISITAPDGFLIEASVTDGRAIHLNVTEKKFTEVE